VGESVYVQVGVLDVGGVGGTVCRVDERQPGAEVEQYLLFNIHHSIESIATSYYLVSVFINLLEISG
jgi:hypothetical protein